MASKQDLAKQQSIISLAERYGLAAEARDKLDEGLALDEILTWLWAIQARLVGSERHFIDPRVKSTHRKENPLPASKPPPLVPSPASKKPKSTEASVSGIHGWFVETDKLVCILISRTIAVRGKARRRRMVQQVSGYDVFNLALRQEARSATFARVRAICCNPTLLSKPQFAKVTCRLGERLLVSQEEFAARDLGLIVSKIDLSAILADPDFEETPKLSSVGSSEDWVADLDWVPLHRETWLVPRNASSSRHTPRGFAATPSFHPERKAFLASLSPIEMYRGTHLTDNETVYYVADFGGIAIADSQDSGNAIYYYASAWGHDWKVIFRRSKPEARARGAKRIKHVNDWQGRVRSLLKQFKTST